MSELKLDAMLNGDNQETDPVTIESIRMVIAAAPRPPLIPENIDLLKKTCDGQNAFVTDKPCPNSPVLIMVANPMPLDESDGLFKYQFLFPVSPVVMFFCESCAETLKLTEKGTTHQISVEYAPPPPDPRELFLNTEADEPKECFHEPFSIEASPADPNAVIIKADKRQPDPNARDPSGGGEPENITTNDPVECEFCGESDPDKCPHYGTEPKERGND
jgi:hypothetical protein